MKNLFAITILFAFSMLIIGCGTPHTVCYTKHKEKQKNIRKAMAKKGPTPYYLRNHKMR